MTTVFGDQADPNTTESRTITQRRVNLFAGATGDHQCIHTLLPARAAKRPSEGACRTKCFNLSAAQVVISPKAWELAR